MLTLKSLLIVLLIHSLLAIKRSEAGVQDWNIRIVGEFDDVSFLRKDRLAVINKAGDLSYINKTSGDVISRTRLTEKQRIIKKNTPGGFDELYYSEQNTLFKVSLQEEQPKPIGKVSGVSSSPVSQIYCHNSICIAVLPFNIAFVSSKESEPAASLRATYGEYIHSLEIKDHQLVVIQLLNNTLCSFTFEIAGNSLANKDKSCIALPKTIIHPLDQYLVLEKDGFVTILDAVTLKQILKEKGSIYKLLPRSSTVLVKTNNSMKKLTITNSKVSDFEMAGIIGETPKGNIFSIAKQNNVFYLQMGGIDRFNWVSNSDQVRSVWVNSINQLQSQMLVQYSDMRVEYFVFEVLTTQPRLTPKWFREEALSEVENTLFLDFQNEKELSNPYYQTLLHKHKQTSFVSLYISRLTFEALAFIEGIQSLFSDLFSIITNININHLLKGESPFVSPHSDSDEKYFGMRKIVLVSTSNDIIFALDSKTSQILWKSNVQHYDNQHSINSSNLKMFRMIADERQKVIVTIQKKHSISLVELDWKTGAQTKVDDIPVTGDAVVFQVGDNELGIKDRQKVQFYSLEKVQTKHSFIFANSNQTHIDCQSILPNSKLFSLWNMAISKDQHLIKATTSFRNDLQSKLPLFKDNIVYLKNVDYTNFAVLTRTNNSNILNLYVLNGENGHVLLHKYKKNIDFEQQINLVYDENTILVSYFNTLNKMFEIWTIEQYKDKTYTQVKEFITQYFKGESSDSHHQKIRNSIVVFETVFGSPLTIKNMYVSTSKLSLIRRNIYIITQKNQIYSLDRRLITTRRPNSENPIQNEKYPPHDYLIPIIPTHFVTYHLNLDLNRIEFSPTALESTFLLFATGRDLFLTRCSPDGTFDMITDSFNYPFLVSVVILVTIILQILKRKVKRARVAKPFLS